MVLFRRGRFLLRLTRELSQKYTLSLVFGFLLGLFGSIALVRFYPLLLSQYFTPVDRIGMVGDFTPTTLPGSVQKLISNGLTKINEDGSALPDAAESWEISDSGKTYTFKLKQNLKWHNDKPVEARDVNYNIKSVTFTVISRNVLQAKLLENYSPFLTLVSKPILLTGLVGFGSYRVASVHLKGDSIDYLRLTPVTDETKHIKEFRFYTTETQAIIAFKRGDIDMLEDLSSPGDLTSWGKTKVTSVTHFDRIVTLFFNLKDGRLSEKSFRQALGYGLPDFGEANAYGPISKTSWAYSDDLRHFLFDESQAAKLLKNTNEGTAAAELKISTFAPYEGIAEKIAGRWTQFGVPTTVKVVNDIFSGFEVLLSAQNIPPDPDQYPFWHSTQAETNLTGYVNVKIDKLLEDGRREQDPKVRKKIYADFTKRLVDDVPAIFLYYPKTYTITRVR